MDGGWCSKEDGEMVVVVVADCREWKKRVTELFPFSLFFFGYYKFQWGKGSPILWFLASLAISFI